VQVESGGRQAAASTGTFCHVITHHRFSIEFACPACGASGKVGVAEEAGPPFTDAPRRTYAIDPRHFVLVVEGDPPAIECVACGAGFPRPF